jgi:CBS domain containing-hemolysin-like protein
MAATVLVAIALLVTVSAFFSASEIAVFSLEDHRFGAIADEPGGRALAALRDDPHRLLVTVLVGNNVVNVAIAALTTALFVDRIGGSAGVVVSTLFASTVVLLFGEILPKSYGVANPERVALGVATPLRAIQVVLYPVVTVFDVVSGWINRLTGGTSDIERPYVTREEIVALVETAEELGIVEADEQSMIERVFRFNATAVGSVMVPRADVIAVDVGASVREAIDVCAESRRTRVPVSEGDLDRVVGYVDVRDLVAAPDDADLRELAHPAMHVFEGREIDEVLAELQASRAELAIVYDEFGAVEGLVTVEDVVEELVGEIFDVGEAPPVLGLSARTATAQGSAATAAVNDELDTHLPTSGETIAGLLSETLGRPPEPGDVVDVADARLTVRTVAGDRVRRVHVERDPERELPDEK